MAGIAADRQAAAGHQAAGLDADIALDFDLAAGHAGADPVEPVAGALDADVLRVAHAQPKSSPTVTRIARRLQLDRAISVAVLPASRCGTSGDRSSRCSGRSRSVRTSGFTAAGP